MGAARQAVSRTSPLVRAKQSVSANGPPNTGGPLARTTTGHKRATRTDLYTGSPNFAFIGDYS